MKSRPKASATPKTKPLVETLWLGTWSKKAAEVLRRDLNEARSIWLAEVEMLTDEHQRRTESKFLKPENANGEVADFHAPRHTFITLLASSGVHPKVAQVLARHSTITLTMDRCSHARLVDLNTAVENLPSLAPRSIWWRTRQRTHCHWPIPLPPKTPRLFGLHARLLSLVMFRAKRT